MKLKNGTFLMLLLTATGVSAQNSLTEFPELTMTIILGAPTLSKPLLITGTKSPVISQGHGLAAPAFYDWDGDGLKDLLIGEFGSGVENGKYIGNFIRVFKNTGTEEKPEFTGQWSYATPPYEMPGNGTPYSVDQYCCIGFTPQFTDLNNDSLPDMITGSYHGEVYFFENTKKGFKQGTVISEAYPKEGDPRHEKNRMKKPHQFYWLYSSASFGDLTGDGLPDMVTGGRALKLATNTGSASEPKFTERQLLLDVSGNPLKVYEYNAEDLKFYEERAFLGYTPPPSGDDDISMYIIDWDNDGVNDILATNSYRHAGLAAVTFFKGIKQSNEIRFQPGIDLFTAKDKKAFPGSGPRISVCDYNNDGINDLLIGASVSTVNGQLSDRFAWTWEKDLDILPAGKDPANLTGLDEETLKRFKETTKIPEGVTVDEFMTLRHVGYVYVMLGSKPQPKPEVSPVKTKSKKKTTKN